MAKTCPSCGYGSIGPFTDNCPICAEPVRNVRSDDAGSDIATPAKYPPLLVIGWVVIGLVLAYMFWGDFVWLLLSAGLCGTAWWAVAQAETLLLRLVGGSLLVLFVPGIWLAAQPNILPGLDRREQTPQRIMGEMMSLMRGTSPESLRLCARMKTISGVIFALHAVVALPLALVAPPLLDSRRRYRLGGPIYLSRPQAIGGLALWLLLLPLVGYLAWPTMGTWAVAPNNVMPNWPNQPWPGGVPPQMPVDPNDLQ